MSKDKIITIIVADDHKMFLEGISALLSKIKSFKIIATVSNGEEVLKAMEKEIPDVVVTDIDMPGMDGLKLTKEIRRKYSQVNILALSMHHESNVIKTMLKNGVTGYILKDTGKEELINAIKTVSEGTIFLSEEIKKVLEEPESKKSNRSNSAFPELSEREVEVLRFIASELTQQQIAEKLFISEHTVIFHRRKLLVKLNVKNTAGLIKRAMEMGVIE